MRRLLALLLLVFSSPAQADTAALPWAKWEPALFDRAAREDKHDLSADVEYPELPEAPAFACANGACSIPVFSPDEVHRIAARVDDR